MQPGVLSQSEIDALLNNIGSTEETVTVAPASQTTGRDVKVYNFRRPDKFSKEQMRSLQLLHESMARALASTLSGRLRGIVQVALVAVEQGTYDDYARQVPENALLSIIAMDPLPGHMVLELSLEASFMLIDRMLGGPGRPLEHPRTVTEIELVLLEGLVSSLLDDIKEGWRKVIELSLRLGEMALSSQLGQITFASDAIIMVVFEIRILDTSGTMTFCLPYSLLEPIASQLNARLLFADVPHAERPGTSAAVKSSLMSVEVPVIVELGSAVVPIHEVLNLRVGDVVRLDRAITSEIEVVVANRPRFFARPGLCGRRLAVVVSSVHPDNQISPEPASV